MIRLGMVDFDTSHVVEFTKRFNHVDIAEDQWVDGAKVIVGYPGTSKISPERIPEYTELMKKYGVQLVEQPSDMIGKVDGVLITSIDGSVHFERTKPFLDAGVPCFVDKPFACSLHDAREMVRLAERRRLPIFSASSLRFAPEVVEFAAKARAKDPATGAILGIMAHGPSPTHPRNPGLFHYGIHPTEMMYTLMGPGCDSVTCLREGGVTEADAARGVDVVTGHWNDERVAVVRGIRSGAAAYGFLAFCEKSVRHVSVTTTYIYRELLKQVVRMFETRQPPIDPNETLELIAFIEAAFKSGGAGGAPVPVHVG